MPPAYAPQLSRRTLVVRAATVSTNDFKNGLTVELDGVPFKVVGEQPPLRAPARHRCRRPRPPPPAAAAPPRPPARPRV
jgi:hypothetical protein